VYQQDGTPRRRPRNGHDARHLRGPKRRIDRPRTHADEQRAACTEALQRCQQEAGNENIDTNELGDYLRECVDSLIVDDSRNDSRNNEQDDNGNTDIPNLEDRAEPELDNLNSL